MTRKTTGGLWRGGDRRLLLEKKLLLAGAPPPAVLPEGELVCDARRVQAISIDGHGFSDSVNIGIQLHQ